MTPEQQRAILEAAAKACGIELEEDGHFWDMSQDPAVLRPWNPLINDGDALRLVVKLKFNLAYKPIDNDIYPKEKSGITVWLRHPVVYGLPHTTKLSSFVYEQHNDDHYAATRRAIVRAAAEIGKQMK